MHQHVLILVVIITMQNFMPMGITKFMGVDPLIGMAASSISMTGGHGFCNYSAPLSMRGSGNSSCTIGC